MSSLIEAINLTKVSGTGAPIKGISFRVQSGQSFGLIGPLGSGKSTAFNVICGRLVIEGGDLFIDGLSVKENATKIKASIGVVPQQKIFEKEFTVLENLLLQLMYFGISGRKAVQKAKELIRRSGLEEFEDRLVTDLTFFEKTKLAIARALVTDPKILLLEEPAHGLELSQKYWVWDEIKSFQSLGGAVFLATQDVDEAQRLCDEVAVISEGVIIEAGTPRELILKHAGHQVLEFEVLPKELEYYVAQIQDDYHYQVKKNKLRLFLPAEAEAHKIMSLVSGSSILLREASLGDALFKAFGQGVGEP